MRITSWFCPSRRVCRRIAVGGVIAMVALPAALPAGLRAQTVRPDADPRIEKLVASVTQQRLQATVLKLASFGTRSTLSDTLSATRGIGAARRWIFDEFKRMSPRLQVSYDRHNLAEQGRITRDVELVNVVAILPGRTPRRVYITGHYDTVNSRRPAAADATARATPPASPVSGRPGFLSGSRLPVARSPASRR